jgi:integrase
MATRRPGWGRVASEVSEVQSWSRNEVQTLLDIARKHEPRFAPLLTLLCSTGLRRGEALGLQWTDVDFEGSILTVRRAVTLAGVTTPKSGRSRRVAMPVSLAADLMDLLTGRRREALKRGWPDVPQWVFCSEAGTQPDPSNVDRVWQRIRRRAGKKGVRPLKLHCARHTWATLALQAGKSVRWVAEQLGHSDPALTLRVYAHAMREEEQDLSFADFGGPGRPYTASDEGDEVDAARNVPEFLARREGLEPPTLRFEA